ncbi:membrane protein insertase YidC [Pseudohoeflea coraliihabitans]|uniref:Membrane protein insertase YidC n=1 Tax=Pseudohoeflea coraliihabitans TaxID=2860393 RepID=A0ABS6WNM8_9HYPH|nr:membrane protein insertase YidC [Pseudohoeflea sp. DP4N28-3]MBW3097568.1 membrane protein insertase YidC [Pseudohoeflea sp. DP4N28-3]
MENNRNYMVAIVLSVLVLIAWQFFYISPKLEAERQAAQQEQALSPTGTQPGAQGTSQGDIPAATPGTAAQNGQAIPGGQTAAPAASRDEAVAGSARVVIDTPALTGSINLTGARIDDLRLKEYHEAVDPESPIITLLSPVGTGRGYFAEVGYVSGSADQAVPGPGTQWTVEGNATLTPDQPVILSWDNGSGLTFTRTIAVDPNFLFTFNDSVRNDSGTAVDLANYGRVTRFFKPVTAGIYVLHEGLIGVAGENGLQEIDYDDVEDDQVIAPGPATGGWLGITDKYWATAVIPQPGTRFEPRFSYFSDGQARYQSDFKADAVSVAPGTSAETTTYIFAGAKEVPVIDGYGEQLNILNFDRMIDWGWFYFITKPMFWLLDFFFRLVGNFGVSILITTVVIKLFFFPLANKSYASMANMKKVQPKMAELKEKFGDDRMALQQAMMELYKKEKINPVAGCWPVLLQIPVFFALYKVIYITIEMRHAPFFGWIQDLSAPDPTSLFNLFGLLPYDVPSFLMIGVWPLIMGITMFLQMRMNPTPPDPTQAMIFTWMPVVFTFMLATFPAGLVIYWAWNNTLSIIQQGVIMKRQGVKIELWGNLRDVFSRKKQAS